MILVINSGGASAPAPTFRPPPFIVLSNYNYMAYEGWLFILAKRDNSYLLLLITVQYNLT